MNDLVEVYLNIEEHQIKGQINFLRDEIIVYSDQTIAFQISENAKIQKQIYNFVTLFQEKEWIKYQHNKGYYEITLLKNLFFNSVTAAAIFVTGKKCSGWNRWILQTNNLPVNTIKPQNYNNSRKGTFMKPKLTVLPINHQKEVIQTTPLVRTNLHLENTDHRIPRVLKTFSFRDQRAVDKINQLVKNKQNVSQIIENYLISLDI